LALEILALLKTLRGKNLMKYRKLGKTDIEVSTVCFGCWALAGGFNWGPQDEQDSIAALRTAYEAGINFFDTAEAYGKGKSEQILGKALADVRNQIVIATKVSPVHFQPEDLQASCEQSLKNLRTDRIDLYQLHFPNHEIPVEETLGIMESLQKSGKIRAYGISNFGPHDLDKVLKTGFKPATNQMAYNLLFRAIEFGIQPLCAEHDISILCYSPIMQGLLAGKFASADDVPVDRARTRHFRGTREQARHGEPGAEKETFDAVAKIRKIAEQNNIPMSDMALAWLLAQPDVTSVIAGGRNPKQSQDNARAADLELSAETVRQLSEATEALKTKLGPNADMWQSESRIE